MRHYFERFTLHHFPSKRCMVSRNVLPGAEYWDTAPFLDFKVFFGVLPRICISEVPWWRPAEMSFFLSLKNQSSIGEASIFLCLFRWRIMELFDGNVESPKKGPVESLTWNSHFIPFLVPKKVPEQNRLSFDETGSGSSDFFLLQKDSSGGAATSLKGFVSI